MEWIVANKLTVIAKSRTISRAILSSSLVFFPESTQRFAHYYF
jgi:hypothetical protein